MTKLCFSIIGLIITIGFISGCCSWNYSKDDFEFTQEELALIGAYNIGDTIYFESNLDDIDTITVVEFLEEKHEGSRCFISREPSNYIVINVNHLPSRTTRYPDTEWATDENGKDVTYQSLISISKSPFDSIGKIASYSISYKGFTTLENALESSPSEFIINNKTLSDCYKVTHGYPERVINPNDIEIVYWTAKYGLTAYTSKLGETWLIKGLE